MAESKPLLEISHVSRADSALWNQFVEDSPQGTFFHTTDWIEILSSTFGRSYDIIFCLKNEQPVGGMIYFHHKKLIWKMITPTAFLPYCSPIFYKPLKEKPQKTIHNHLLIAERIENYLRTQYDYWVLDVPYTSRDVRSYLWRGAVVEPQYTYVVSVTNKEAVFENFNQSVRKKLKQAQNENAVVRESSDPTLLAELVTKSYHRHGMKPLISKEQLSMLLNKVIHIEQAKLFYAELNRKIIAGRLVIIDGAFGYDLLAGGEDHPGYGSTFLTAYILEKYAGVIEKFDFLGANHPQIEQFKRGFGGELIQGFRVTNKTRIPLSWIIKIYENRMQRERIL
jgi:hypothetical protein